MSVNAAQQFHTDQTHYLRSTLSFSDSVVSLGWVPAGAVITAGAATVATAFDAGTTNTIHIGFRNAGDGTADDASGFASALAAGSVGRKQADDMGAATNLYFPEGAEIFTTYNQSGTAPTAGTAYVHVEYTVNNKD